MRAQEFIKESRARLDAFQAGPLQHTYIIPGIRNNDAYHTMRLGVAMARARAEIGGVDQDMPAWTTQSAFGQNAIVAGFNDSVEQVIDRALALTDTPGGKELVGTVNSKEPDSTVSRSPIVAFAGYPR
jgi:hypothetical protein